MRERKCKHENAEHMMPGDASTPDWCVQVYAEVEQFRCLDCGAYLSLGPARMTPEVAVELKAAQLAADRGGPFGADRFDYCPETKSDELCQLCEAYWLAHEINRVEVES